MVSRLPSISRLPNLIEIIYGNTSAMVYDQNEWIPSVVTSFREG